MRLGRLLVGVLLVFTGAVGGWTSAETHKESVVILNNSKVSMFVLTLCRKLFLVLLRCFAGPISAGCAKQLMGGIARP